MMRYVAVGALVLGVAAVPISVEAQNPQQLLQGLTNGDSSRDQAVNEAFQRGYQKGRQDEQRMASQQRRGLSNDADRPFDAFGLNPDVQRHAVTEASRHGERFRAGCRDFDGHLREAPIEP